MRPDELEEEARVHKTIESYEGFPHHCLIPHAFEASSAAAGADPKDSLTNKY